MSKALRHGTYDEVVTWVVVMLAGKVAEVVFQGAVSVLFFNSCVVSCGWFSCLWFFVRVFRPDIIIIIII